MMSDRQMGCQTDRLLRGQTDRCDVRHVNWMSDIRNVRETDKMSGGQMDRQAERLDVRQTDGTSEKQTVMLSGRPM